MINKLVVLLVFFLLNILQPIIGQYSEIKKTFKKKKECSGLTLNKYIGSQVLDNDQMYSLKDSLHYRSFQIIIFRQIASNKVSYVSCFFDSCRFFDCKIIDVGMLNDQKEMTTYFGDYGYREKLNCLVFYCFSFRPFNLDSIKTSPFQEFRKDVKEDSVVLCRPPC